RCDHGVLLLEPGNVEHVLSGRTHEEKHVSLARLRCLPYPELWQCGAMSVPRGAALALTLLLVGGSAHAQLAAGTQTAPQPEPMPAPWDGLGEDVVAAFTGTNLLLYGGAVAATGVMAFGGADHAIRVGVQRNLVAPVLDDGAYYGGYLLPAIVAPATYLV